MKTQLRVLLLEDDPNDADIIRATLETEGFALEIQRTATRAQFILALDRSDLDLIISDFTMPSFDGLRALSVAQAKRPDIPFLFFSGTIGEELGVESLKNGAADYVLKQRPERLVTAVKRVLREADERAKRREAEEQIREQAELLEKAHDAICVTDMEQRIVYWNNGAERLYGWKRGEAVGRNANEILFQPHSLEPLQALKRLIAKGEWRGRIPQNTRRGEELVVESGWTLMRGKGGKPKSILIINTDITERAKLETQFLRAQRLENLGALAGGVAHDLNNVLSPILMAVGLLRVSVSDPEATKVLDTLEASAQRGADLVKQILSFARGVAGAKGVVQVRHLIEDMRKLVASTFPASIELEIDVPRDLRAVTADATQLYQVLLNLCVNARDAMPQGGLLRIEARNVTLDEQFVRMQPEARPGPHIILTVADSGIGIAPEITDKIFAPFFTTKEAGKGTGLGLATVKSIVRNHDGFVTVQSEVNKGTQFSFYLPALSSGDTAHLVKEHTYFYAGSGELILVVDDEASVREITRATLETYGYRVETARDGADALAKYVQRRAEIRLVILDLQMPFMDGTATARALRQMDASLPIVVASGMDMDKGLLNASGLALQGVITKPYTAEKLLGQVNAALQGITAVVTTSN